MRNPEGDDENVARSNPMQARRPVPRVIIRLALWGLVLLGCTPAPGAPPPAPAGRLRIRNSNALPLDRAVIIFPDERITFGPVPAGATSAYQPVQQGVYGNAAYEVTFAARTIQQPVVDWIGAQPLAGSAFTYVLVIDPRQPEGLMIRSEVRQP
jgi:hypothetical protein